ncbi:MAG TPA: polysulfide reductase NrfD, partial [Clostridia bacterium]|nr:polysulfide reductase NrfD [Clostridia bacterium]
SIHTVTAFLYAGLPGRDYWLTALMGARFLASAFASGPALLILLCFVVKRVSNFDPGEEALGKLSVIITYALAISLFFVGLEFFTAFYSQVPGHMEGLTYLFWGLEGQGNLVPFMWLFVILAVAGFILLINPRTRRQESTLKIACVAVFIAMLLEKGLGLVVTGFIPNPLDTVVEYAPTAPEMAITVGIWAIGFLIITVLYKMAIGVKEEIDF